MDISDLVGATLTGGEIGGGFIGLRFDKHGAKLALTTTYEIAFSERSAAIGASSIENFSKDAADAIGQRVTKVVYSSRLRSWQISFSLGAVAYVYSTDSPRDNLFILKSESSPLWFASDP